MGKPPPLPPTPTQTLMLAVFVTAVAIFFWILWLPITSRAVRTGRLLGQGVVYDRQTTPIRYWLGFLSLTLGLLMTSMAAFVIVMAALSFMK